MAIIKLIIDNRAAAAKPFLKTEMPVDDMTKTISNLIEYKVATACPYFEYKNGDIKSANMGEGFDICLLLIKPVSNVLAVMDDDERQELNFIVANLSAPPF